MIKYTYILLLLAGLLSGTLLEAQTAVTFTSDSTMMDADVANRGDETVNFGGQNDMSVFHERGSTSKVYRTFIQYDLSAIPAGAIITEANLKLNAKSVDNTKYHPIYIARVNDTTWADSVITWNNQPDVIEVDRLSFTHAHTSSTGLHEFDVTGHVQTMVNNPGSNNGWRIRLQSESAPRDFGIVYHSSQTSDPAKRPVLGVEYIMPIEMETEVVHCTAGNDDGTLSVMVSGGSTYTDANMNFYKTERDLSAPGTATTSNYKVTGNLQYNSITGEVTAEDLEPGIYILQILDNEYYANSDLRFSFYKHILVGREGETTSGLLFPNYAYQENTSIEYDKPSNSTPLDRANTNFHSGATSIQLSVGDSPNDYEKASLIKYNIDFDDQLVFTKAELQIKAWSNFYRNSSSSNAVVYSLVTSDWEEDLVTWNIRPTIDSTLTVTVPTTTYIGYDPVHNSDTVSLMPFVDYWLEHPTENFGFEIALETYGATQLAQRDYKSTENDLNFVCFEFGVKNPVSSTFDDATNTGTLTVEAPSGALPYRYLINSEPLGTLADAWEEIGDTTIIDSLEFFSGDISTTEYTFSGLPSGQYYVGVYDNTGNKILDGSGVVNTEILLYNDTDLDFSSDNLITRSSSASGNGKGRVYAELLADDSWGGMNFAIVSLGDFYLGFNKTSDAVANNASDIEFGISVSPSGRFQVIENNVILPAGSQRLHSGDELALVRLNDDYLIYINDSEVYSGEITALAGENASMDVVLPTTAGTLEALNYYGKFKLFSYSADKIVYPICPEKVGELTVSHSEFATITICTLTDNHGEIPMITGVEDMITGDFVFENVPIGTYELEVEYTIIDIYDEITIINRKKQVAIGYVVEWEEMYQNHVFDGTVNTIGLNPIILYGDPWATANSANITINDALNWVQFETSVFTSPLFSMSNAESFSYRNSNEIDDVAFKLTTSVMGTTFEFTSPEEIYLGMSLIGDPEGVWRVDQEGADVSIFREGDFIIDEEISDFSPYEIAIRQRGNVEYIRTICSYCSYIPNQFFEPKREIEGGYFLVPSDDLLRFEFTEEYNLGSDLKYNVKDFQGIEIGGLAGLTESFGDNRFTLDVSSLVDGHYILEVINDKGENWFLRFEVQ